MHKAIHNIMNEMLEKHKGSVNSGGKIFTNLRLADDIDGLAFSELKLVNLIS